MHRFRKFCFWHFEIAAVSWTSLLHFDFTTANIKVFCRRPFSRISHTVYTVKAFIKQVNGHENIEKYQKYLLMYDSVQRKGRLSRDCGFENYYPNKIWKNQLESYFFNHNIMNKVLQEWTVILTFSLISSRTCVRFVRSLCTTPKEK